ncbi:cytokinesis protein 3 [Colletotrichum chlorophyti]|uniref:Cytokinesis protein 3 n=1 Tax=Colletotrichum chlorophyti TaxID=708187 RepID=A0A1Q8RKM8_9PEZI|nr:cytokinesis protein 3 [Colletotrichum chlorophyti]
MVPAPPALPTRFPCWCRAVYSWGGESKRDLGFIEGDLIECLNAGDGSWWTGRLWRDRRTVGVFPSNFVEVLPSDFRPTTRSASPLPAEVAPSPSTPQKSRTFRKPFEAYAKAPHYTAAKQPEVYRTNPNPRPRGHSGESALSTAPDHRNRDRSPLPEQRRRDWSPMPEQRQRELSPMPEQRRRDRSPLPEQRYRDRSPAPGALLARENSFNDAASTRMRAYTAPAPSGYVSRGNSFNDGAQQYVPARGRTSVPDVGHGSRVNSYNTERGPSPVPPHGYSSRGVSPAPSISYKPYRPPTREKVESPPPPAPPPHRHVATPRHKQSISYDSRHDVSRQESNAGYDRFEAGRHGSNSSFDKRFDLARQGSNASYDNRHPPLDRQGSHLSYTPHRPPPIRTTRQPSPSPPSPAASHMTPSPLREAMDGVIEQLDALGMPRDPTPEPPLDPWSPESFNMVNDRARRKSTYQRPQTSMGIALPDEGYETWSGGSSRDQSYQHGNREDKEQLPQLSNYVERMESRLKKMHQHSASMADLEDEAPKPPPKGTLYERPKSSMGGAEERKLRGRKSAYDIGRNVLNRTFTTKTNSTSASSGNQSSTTQSSDRSLMSGSSAGAISATSAGSFARKTQKRAQSALGMRDADIERPETPFTGVTYHSSHASEVPRPKSQAGFQDDAGLGGLVTPKPPKRNIFKKLLDTAKTGVASGRSSIAMGADSPRSSPFARSMPNVASPSNTAISNMTGMGSSGFGREGARDMGLANGVDWVQVRRDVNRSNSLSKNERIERRDRCQMLDHPALNPVDELYEGMEGDEGADGLPVEDPIDYQSLNLTQVDKNSRFLSSLPATTSAATLATNYVCRPYRSDVQRLRAIFTWVAEKIVWEEDFDGEIDTRRVIQSKRASAEEYALLVSDMCSAVGIHCEVVRGYLKTPGEIPEHNIMPRANHWWNAVLVDNEWRIMDCCLASPSYPKRHLYSSAGGGSADAWWFLTRPTEICWTHIPEHHTQQHICPPQAHEVLLNLPSACPPFFKNMLEMVDYNTAATRIEDLEMVHIKFNVPADVEVAAEVEVRGYTRDVDGDVFESGEIVKKRALAQAEWFNGTKRYTVKALLPGDEGQGVLKVYAGKRGLMHSIKDIPHPVAFALPIIHTGENPPYEFVTRHPTPHAQRHDIYVVQPQCQRLALNNTFVFAIRQHPSSVTGGTGSVMTPSSNPGGASPIPFARPGSAMSMTASNASGSNLSTAGGGKKPAKLAIQTPGGKILRLMRKEDRRGISVGGRGSEEETSDGGTWETIIKCSEKGRDMADRTSRTAAPPGAPRRAVRRNLFQGLSRRPTGPTGAPVSTMTSVAVGGGGGGAAAAAAGGATMVAGGPASSNSAETLRLDVDVLSDGGPPPPAAAAEIVVRDEHGEIELGELPALVFDEADDAAAMDDREESKKERQRLAEAVKQHQVNHATVRDQPEELLEAVRASLRAKVAALAEDNWMYEAEPEQPRSF